MAARRFAQRILDRPRQPLDPPRIAACAVQSQIAREGPNRMTSSSPAGRGMRVLFTGQREASNWEPWGREMLTALSRSHDVTLADPDRPLVDQVADPAIEVVP